MREDRTSGATASRSLSVVERLRELEAAATKGPWRSYREHSLHHAGPVVCADGFAEGSIFVAETAWDATSCPDVEFIAESRNALPLLLAVVSAADEYLSVPRDIQRAPDGHFYRADVVPQQEARKKLATALAALNTADCQQSAPKDSDGPAPKPERKDA